MVILRLRGCLARWRAREPRIDDDDDNGDEMLRSQLVAGLHPGPVQVELQKLLRRNPTLKFADVSKEAKAVEHEQDHHAEEAVQGGPMFLHHPLYQPNLRMNAERSERP